MGTDPARQRVSIDGRQLEGSNLEKVLFPEVGFTKAEVIHYYVQIAPALLPARDDSPFDGALPREVTRDAHGVEPDVVGEVAYAGWTAEGRLRHPAWRGLRDDLEPDDVVVEP